MSAMFFEGSRAPRSVDRLVDRFNSWWGSPRSAKWRGLRSLSISYVLSRLLMIAIPFGLFPYNSGPLILNDVKLYQAWSDVILAGHYPISDPMWQYPPLAGFVFALGAHLTTNPLLGFVLLALLADLAIFVVLLRKGIKVGRLDGAWTYVIAGIAIGPVLLTRFDVFPTLFAVLALILIAKPVRSGIMIGIGTLLKVWPAFLIVAHPRRALGKVTAAMAATVIASMSLMSMWGYGMFSFLKEQGDRGLQIESVGGGVYVIAQFLGIDMQTVFRYGSMEINAVGAGLIATAVTIAGFIAMGAIGYARLRGRLESVSGADVALTVVLISIASSRVFSPQYMIWVAGIAGVCMLDPKSRLRPVIWLLLPVAICGQLVYPWFYGSMMDGGWYGVLVQTIRVGLLMIATVWAMVRVMRPAASDPSTAASLTPHSDTRTAELA